MLELRTGWQTDIRRFLVLLQTISRHCEGGGGEGTHAMVSVLWKCTNACACVTQ